MRNGTLRGLALLLLAPLIINAGRGRAQDRSAALAETVKAMARLDNDGRRDHLRLRLMEAGLKPQRQDFAADSGAPGRNLVVTFGDTGPAVVLSAHYDRIKISPGANDNASGCAVLLELARELAKVPRDGAPRRMVIVAFLDRCSSRSYGPLGLLARLPATPILGCLDVDMVGVGDTVLFGPQSWPRVDVAQSALMAALAGIPESELPRRGLRKMPPSDVAGYRDHGLDAVTISMAPSGELEELTSYLEWSRKSGKRRPRRPAYLARARTPRDAASQVSEAALAKALRAARAWLAEMSKRTAAGTKPKPDYKKDCRAFRDLLRRGTPAELGGRTGEHVELMASLGPHGVFRTILAVLAADTEGLAEPAVRKVLGTYLSGPGLVRPVEVLMEDSAPVPLSEGLADLYRASWSRLTWDPSIPAFRLTTKDVKGRTSDRR